MDFGLAASRRPGMTISGQIPFRGSRVPAGDAPPLRAPEYRGIAGWAEPGACRGKPIIPPPRHGMGSAPLSPSCNLPLAAAASHEAQQRVW